MKNVLIICRTFEHAKFFVRMTRSLIKRSYNPIFITTSLAIFFYLKRNQCEVHIVTRRNALLGKNYIIEDNRIKQTLEYNLNKLSLEEARLVYQAVYYRISLIHKSKAIYAAFIWGGTSVADFSIQDFSIKYDIKTLFFEIANIPGKIFVDRKGTNAKSELYKNKSILNRYHTDLPRYNQWKFQYIKGKMERHIVPQARKVHDRFNMNALINILGYYFYTNLDNNTRFIKQKFLSIGRGITQRFAYDLVDYQKLNYIFFPLQVSSDSQILLNSKIGLIEGLEYAIEKAAREKKMLMIKPHPAETDCHALDKLLECKKKHRFYFVNENTFKLIEHADYTITINSTVGLEALILGKKIEVLGKAFYCGFSEQDLANYIMGYLVDIDFFADEEIDQKHIDCLLSRM